jgi:hypothetical protein
MALMHRATAKYYRDEYVRHCRYHIMGRRFVARLARNARLEQRVRAGLRRCATTVRRHVMTAWQHFTMAKRASHASMARALQYFKRVRVGVAASLWRHEAQRKRFVAAVLQQHSLTRRRRTLTYLMRCWRFGGRAEAYFAKHGLVRVWTAFRKGLKTRARERVRRRDARLVSDHA